VIYKVLAIRDRAANVFGQPIFVTATGAGIRSFSDAINGGDQTLTKHPEDFDLWELGVYTDNDGVFTQDKPFQVAVGKDLVVKAAGDPRQRDAFTS